MREKIRSNMRTKRTTKGIEKSPTKENVIERRFGRFKNHLQDSDPPVQDSNNNQIMKTPSDCRPLQIDW